MSLRTTTSTSEKAILKSMISPRRSVHHPSFLWASCHELVRSTTQRFVAHSGDGFPFSEITPVRPRPSNRLRAAFES